MNLFKRILMPYKCGYDDGYENGTAQYSAFYDAYFLQKKYLDKAVRLLMVALNMNIEDMNQWEAVLQAIRTSTDEERKNKE